MKTGQLIDHFSTVNSVGLQSHCGDVDSWAKGQMALLSSEVVGLRARLNQCGSGMESHEDAEGFAQSTIFRRRLLLASIQTTKDILQATEHALTLTTWATELRDMGPSIAKIESSLATKPPTPVTHAGF